MENIFADGKKRLSNCLYVSIESFYTTAIISWNEESRLTPNSKSLTFDYPLMQSFLVKKRVFIQLIDVRENGFTTDKDDTFK